MIPYFVEALGTFFLVLAVTMTSNPLAIGLMFMAMIYVTLHLSGGHFNPAITLAIWVRSGLGKRSLWGYWIAQLVGACVAIGFFMATTGQRFLPHPAYDTDLWKTFSIEYLATFVLCLVVLSLLLHEKMRNHEIYGLVVGLTLTGLLFIAAPVSSAVLNPAIALGAVICDATKTGNILIPLTSIYLTATLFAGASAAYIHRGIHE